ncbi:MAG: Ig-like domain-containing protein [Halanaerobiales bacterium]
MVKWDFHDEGVGIHQSQPYQYNVTEIDKKPESGEYINQSSKVLDKDDLDLALNTRQAYYLWVRAFDNFENTSDWHSTDPFTLLPERIDSSKISIDTSSILEDSEPRYRNEIIISQGDFAYLVVERQEEGQEKWNRVAKMAYDNNAKEYIIVDNNLNAHGQYRYRLHTENALSERQSYETEKTTIPNIPLSDQREHNDIRLKNNDNVVNNLITEEYITNNNEFTIEMPKNDLEGDNIEYRLLDINNDQIKDGWQEGETAFSLDNDGKYQWYIQARDYWEGDNTGEQIRIPGKESEFFTIIIDTSPPHNNSFEIYNSSEFAADHYTNSRAVELLNLEFEDNNQLDRVYIWNESEKPDTFKTYTTGELLSPEIMESIGALEAGIVIELQGQIKEFEEKVDWVLAEGGDGEREVYMEVFDKAQNSTLIKQKIIYDKTPPKTPNKFSHHHSEDGKSIKFVWQNEEDDLAAFNGNLNVGEKIIEIDEDEIELTYDNEIITSAEYTIELADDISANSPIELQINARDKAGNYSMEAGEYTAYTLAELGSVEYDDGGYDDGIGDKRHHYLQFKLKEAGIAASHGLQYGHQEDREFIKSGELSLINENTFLHQELEPRDEFAYRLVAYNNSDDPVYGEAFTVSVPNVEPFAAEIKKEHYPQGWNIEVDEKDQVVFEFNPATDVDGDVLEHTIYWAEGENPTGEEFNRYRKADPDSRALKRSDLEHGKTFTWYVHAQELDTEEKYEVNSDMVHFTVDENNPLIEFSEESKEIDFYTNRKNVKVLLTDILDSVNPDEIYSDINKITYEYVENGEVSKKAELEPVASGDTGYWEAEVPLIEGEHTLRVYASDNASNQSDIISMELLVDHTLPVIEEIVFDLASDSSGRYLSYKDIITLESVKIKDPVSEEKSSGLARLEYYFDNEELGQSKSSNINVYEGSEYSIDMSNLENGQEYTIVFEAVDNAGNRSEKEEIEGLYIDRTAPTASIEIDGYQVHGSNSYLSDLSKIDIVYSSSDEESAIEEEKFNILSEDSGELVLEDWVDINTIKEVSLKDGESYQIAFRAVNGVGNETIDYSTSFIYDTIPPVNLSLEFPTSVYSSGETMIIEVDAEDEESAIKEYKLAIGSSPEGKELTSEIYGEQDGYIVLELVNNQGRIQIPEIEDGIYYTSLLVSNAAGLESSISGENIEINNQLERLVVNDQGPYTGSDNQLSASWQYNGEQEVSGYNYRIKEIDGGYITESKYTSKKEVTVRDLDLISGTGYQFELIAQFIDDSESNVAYSPGVTVDAEEPTLISFAAPEYSTSERIIFDWEAEDEISGIDKVEIALGSDYNKTDITGGWVELIDNGLSYDSNGKALTEILESGEQYYPILRVTDGAGNLKERVATAITIDDTAAPEPIVNLNGKHFNPEQPIILDWTMTELMGRIDQESANVAYYWTFTTDREDLELNNKQLKWHESSDELKVRFDNIEDLLGYKPVDGSRIYFAVKVVNGTGLENISLSESLIYDSTAPSIPELRILEAVNLNGEEIVEEVNYINNAEKLKLWIYSTDFIALVDSYQYRYGLIDEIDEAEGNLYEITDPDLYNQPQIIDIDSPSLTGGMIYQFAGESYNQAELVSVTGYSSGIMLDNSYPEIGFVNGIANDEQLYFNWEVKEDSSISNVVKYETALVSDPTIEPGAEDWQDNGLSRILEMDASDLADGIYYLKVRALNAAGNYSRTGVEGEVGVSSGVLLDRTAPEISRIAHQPYTHQEFDFIIEAEDNLSGIASYQYALGSLLNEKEYTGSWIEVERNFDHANLEDRIEGVLNTLDIEHREEIYLRTRVKDNANLWSEIKRGETILIDHTAPELASITGPSHTNTTDRIEDLEIEYGDSESGVTQYRISVANEKEGDWLTDSGFRPIGDYNNLVSELSLEEGEYYLVLEVRNLVGLSTTAYSEEAVVIDTTAPEMEYLDLADEIVYNLEEIDVSSDIRYTVNEDANVSFTLRYPDGSKENCDSVLVRGNVEDTYSFTEEAYGTYILTADVVDLAGNSIEESPRQIIRVNRPPVIKFTERDGISFSTTPGQEITIKTNEAYDPDGEIVSYLWTDEEGQELSRDSEFVYSNVNTGIYKINLKATDNNGASTEVSTKIEVHNTRSGTLFWHETWSGKHYIEGDIIVPAELTLTIEAGTVVEVVEGADGYENQLLINGTLGIGEKDNQEQNISFYLDNSISGNWQGILINRNAEIYNLNIQDAFRAVTVTENANLLVNNSIFSNNMIGVHVLGVSPEIKNSQFINNHLYGVKEDAGGCPLMIENYFKNNGMNYYHHQLARYTMDELNNLDGNSGNYQD